MRRGFFLITAAACALILSASAQAVNPLGSQFRVSKMGQDGDANYDGFDSAVAHNPKRNQYLVVWCGSDTTAGEDEAWGRLYRSSGKPLGGEFRISEMGPDGNAAYDAGDCAVAYNSSANQYLVVWEGDDDTAPLVDNEFEIFGQRLGPAGGELGRNDFRISDMGPDSDASHAALDPAVVYNRRTNQYLVAWHGDDVDEEFEIFAQRLSTTGDALGTNDFRVSDMGPDGDTDYDAFNPALAYNAVRREFLVAWDGDDDSAPLVNGESEIFAQRLSGSGGLVGANDFRISNMGPDGNSDFIAFNAAVAFNPQANQYLVAWQGEDDRGALVDEEFEIFAQRLSATGARRGANDFRVSDMGPDGNPDYDGVDPAVAFNRRARSYLVVWQGDDDTGPLVDEEDEIYGQRLSAAGAVRGRNDVRLSRMGPNGDTSYNATDVAATSHAKGAQYFVAWHGDHDAGALADDELEIWARRAAASR